MKQKITIEDFMKLDLRVGEIISYIQGKIKINCGEKILEGKIDLNVKKGEQIIVLVNSNRLVISLVNGEVPLVPEKDMGDGCRIG